MTKRCPSCQKSLRRVGEVSLNFAHPLVGGEPLKALFWSGDYNGLVLLAAFGGGALFALLNLPVAGYLTVLPAFGWIILNSLSPKPLFKCTHCQTIFAGRRLIRYDASDDVYH